MHERELRERRTGRHYHLTQSLLRKTGFQAVKRHRLLDFKLAHPRATQLSQMCANGQTLAKIFRKRPHVSPRRADDVSAKIECAVQIVLDQLTVCLDSGELMNTNTNRLTVPLFTTPRKFVQLLA